MIKIYGYSKCSTCVKALKFLKAKGLKFEQHDIVETPPSIKELSTMLGYLKAAGFGLNRLFNASGEQYRTLHMSEKLKAGMTESAALKLLSQNGKLVKRPFVLTASNGTVGFSPEVWDELF